MKLRLGIFGDSYGSHAINETQFPDKGWPDLIKDSNLYDVENFSRGGSDLYFSYKKFIQHHEKFDKVIFLVTNPNRIYLPDLNTFTNVSQAVAKLSLASEEHKEQFETVINYYKYIHDMDKDLVFHELLFNKIVSLRPDCLMYPCFDLPFMDDFSLYKITYFEDLKLGVNNTVRHRYYLDGLDDSRKCHMTGPNNKLVAEMFLQRLAGKNAVIDSSKLVTPEQPLEYYYQTKFSYHSNKNKMRV